MMADLAVEDDYGGMVAAGQRTHRIEYLFDPRGIGHSTPSLDLSRGPCRQPGARGPSPHRPGPNDGPRGGRRRRATTGWSGKAFDLSAYDVQANAEDIEELRTSLRIAFMEPGGRRRHVAHCLRGRPTVSRRPTVPVCRLAHAAGTGLPEPFGPRPSTVPSPSSRTSARLEGVCPRISPPRNPDRSSPDSARRQTRAFDVVGSPAAIQAGHPIHVVVDGAALLRWIRASLGSDGGQAAPESTAHRSGSAGRHAYRQRSTRRRPRGGLRRLPRRATALSTVELWRALLDCLPRSGRPRGPIATPGVDRRATRPTPTSSIRARCWPAAASGLSVRLSRRPRDP